MTTYKSLQMPRFNMNMDDSEIARITFIREKLDKYWDEVAQMKAGDAYGNQLMIHLNMEKIALLQEMLNHFLYN